jgi:hypothetical protein
MLLVLPALWILSIVRYSYMEENISRTRSAPVLSLRVPDQMGLLNKEILSHCNFISVQIPSTAVTIFPFSRQN